MMHHSNQPALSMKQIEDALMASAELVDRYGEVMLPFYQLFEQQYLVIQSQQSAMDRAKALLAAKKPASKVASLPKPDDSSDRR